LKIAKKPIRQNDSFVQCPVFDSREEYVMDLEITILERLKSTKLRLGDGIAVSIMLGKDTLEALISAVDKQIAKKLIGGYDCPVCGVSIDDNFDNHCSNCGQRIEE